MFHRVIAVLSDVQDRAIRLSRMSPRPQRPLSTGTPAWPFLLLLSDIYRIFLVLFLPLLLSLPLPPPSPHLLGLFYFPVALLFSKYSTQFNRTTATRASATAAWSVTLPVVTPPSRDMFPS